MSRPYFGATTEPIKQWPGNWNSFDVIPCHPKPNSPRERAPLHLQTHSMGNFALESKVDNRFLQMRPTRCST
jgi:hypothetical protein